MTHKINVLNELLQNHLVIGIDIAKEIQVARAVTYRRIEVAKPCSFTNDLSGFELFHHWMQALQREYLRYIDQIVGGIYIF